MHATTNYYNLACPSKQNRADQQQQQQQKIKVKNKKPQPNYNNDANY